MPTFQSNQRIKNHADHCHTWHEMLVITNQWPNLDELGLRCTKKTNIAKGSCSLLMSRRSIGRAMGFAFTHNMLIPNQVLNRRTLDTRVIIFQPWDPSSRVHLQIAHLNSPPQSSIACSFLFSKLIQKTALSVLDDFSEVSAVNLNNK